MAEKGRSYLLVPAAGAGDGMGHLNRCLGLAGRLGPRAAILTARMDTASRAFLMERLAAVPARRRPAVVNRITAGQRWDLIIVDARRTRRSEIVHLKAHGLVVCLDEGGDAARYASFLIDTIPGLPGGRPANLSSPAFLDLPPRSRPSKGRGRRRLLVSFGGEDAEDLSGRLLDAVIGAKVFDASSIIVVEGPLFKRHEWPEGVAVVRQAESLHSHIAAADLVITHFGITAFEALASGVPAILLNPTRYHAALARASGIPSIGTGIPDVRLLRALLDEPSRIMEPVEAFNAALGRERDGRLAKVLSTLVPQAESTCHACGSDDTVVVARFAERTYRQCAACGVISLESFVAERKSYGARYFHAEYKAQYGRTYLEDFEAIKTASRTRVRVVRELLQRDVVGAIVDVGCAYGPFLDAAREAGMACYGIDVSQQAVAYVRNRLGIPALCAPFETVARAALPRRIAAVTLWYVIEHFPDTELVLRKAAALLPVGGVFAFSTPNGRGISARKSLVEFLRAGPGDHFTVLSPQRLRGLLARYGLELRRVRVTGHHPERFPWPLGKAADRWPWMYRALGGVSRVLGLGDTFEAYAVKGE